MANRLFKEPSALCLMPDPVHFVLGALGVLVEGAAVLEVLQMSQPSVLAPSCSGRWGPQAPPC